jgi:short subunit fatty acids transporter
MIIIRCIEFLHSRLRPLIFLCVLVLVLLVVGDWLLVNKAGAHTATEHWFGFWSLFGFLSCLAIIFFSKWFGHLGIMKPEDYYDND